MPIRARFPHARFAEIAEEVGAKLLVDMAHYAGLVAAGLHDNPVPVADFVTTTTHKTLRGPRAGLCLCKQEYAKELDRSVFPGLQGGPLMHVVAGKAVCLQEALQPEFHSYAQQVIENAQVLAEVLQQGGCNWSAGERITICCWPMSRHWVWVERSPNELWNAAESRSTKT